MSEHDLIRNRLTRLTFHGSRWNHQSLHLLIASLLAASLILAGCSRDPNVRKQKFVAQGDAYFKDGKYPEAQISYTRALQIDPRYVVALYKSAQCSERVGNWNSAFRELSRAVDLEPENWPAHLELGKIFLASGNAQEAKNRALLILRSNPRHADAKMLLAGGDAVLGNQKEALS